MQQVWEEGRYIITTDNTAVRRRPGQKGSVAGCGTARAVEKAILKPHMVSQSVWEPAM